MSAVSEFYRSLAEALAPLSHSLAAGLLIRPVPLRADIKPQSEEGPFAGDSGQAGILCFDAHDLLREAVPAMRQAMAALETCAPEELEELVDELASPALELVDMSRRIWESPLPPEAEGARPLLATLVEAPAVQLLQWILEILHICIDPWSIAEDPEKPDISFALRIPDMPVREALARWRKGHPGILPEEPLR